MDVLLCFTLRDEAAASPHQAVLNKSLRTDRREEGLLPFSYSHLNESSVQKRISTALHLIHPEPGCGDGFIKPSTLWAVTPERATAAEGMGNNNTVIRLTFTTGIGYHIQFLPANP